MAKISNKLLQNLWKKLKTSDLLEMDIANNGFNKQKSVDYMSMIGLFKILKTSKLQDKFLLIWKQPNLNKLIKNIKI